MILLLLKLNMSNTKVHQEYLFTPNGVILGAAAVGGGVITYYGLTQYKETGAWTYLIVGVVVVLILLMMICTRYINQLRTSTSSDTTILDDGTGDTNGNGTIASYDPTYLSKYYPRVWSSTKIRTPGWYCVWNKEKKMYACWHLTNVHFGKPRDIGYRGAAALNVVTNISPSDYEGRVDLAGIKAPHSFLPGIPAGTTKGVGKHSTIQDSGYVTPPHVSKNPTLVRTDIGERISPFTVSNIGVEDRLGRIDLHQSKYGGKALSADSPYSDYHNPYHMGAFKKTDRGPSIGTTEWQMKQSGLL